jgi:nitrogen regulatory protein P-II 1
MKLKYIMAIVAPEAVRPLEASLVRAGIAGITLTKVKGFGRYKNFFTEDWLSDHVKIEILTDDEKVPDILDILMEGAGSDLPGSGIVAVMPVDTILPLRARGPAVAA